MMCQEIQQFLIIKARAAAGHLLTCFLQAASTLSAPAGLQQTCARRGWLLEMLPWTIIRPDLRFHVKEAELQDHPVMSAIMPGLTRIGMQEEMDKQMYMFAVFHL